MHSEYWIHKVLRAFVFTYQDLDQHGVHTTVPPQQKPLKEWQKLDQKKITVKISLVRWQKIQSGKRQKLDEDNKKRWPYDSGMVGGPHASKTDKKEAEAVNSKQVLHCSHCKSHTHQCRMSTSCAMNPNNLAAKENVDENKNCVKVSVTPYLTIYCQSRNWQRTHRPSTNFHVHPTCVWIMTEDKSENFSDSSYFKRWRVSWELLFLWNSGYWAAWAMRLRWQRRHQCLL